MVREAMGGALFYIVVHVTIMCNNQIFVNNRTVIASKFKNLQLNIQLNTRHHRHSRQNNEIQAKLKSDNRIMTCTTE
jgi:hypothetical protein